MKQFYFTLHTVMEEHQITRCRLQKEADVGINAVRGIYDNTTRRLDLPLLEKIVHALNRITGKSFTGTDILKWGEMPDMQKEIIQKKLQTDRKLTNADRAYLTSLMEKA